MARAPRPTAPRSTKPVKRAAEPRSVRSKTPARISQDLLARVKSLKPPALERGVRADQVFALSSPPPALSGGKKLPALANDSALTTAAGWAGTQLALNSFFQEGLTFLGYPYLAELTQRPEYRMICETPALEMTRKWIRFRSKSGDDKGRNKRISELTDEFERLRVRDMFRDAITQDGFFGRGHIYIDTGDTDDPTELKMPMGNGWDLISRAKVSPEKPIQSLRTVEAVWVYPVNYNASDPLKPTWYRPASWFVQSKQVDASRLLTLVARPVSDLLKPTYNFGGLPLSQLAKPYVDNWLRTRQSVNDIISAFTVFVLYTNLGARLQMDGEQVVARAELFNSVRDNSGLMMVDKNGEDFANVSAPLGSLDLLQAQAQEHMCSVAHTPVVKLLGIQPAGLNASSEGELRSYYDWINSCQEALCRRPIHQLMGLVMHSLWGAVDEDIVFEFVPLWALDEAGEAGVKKTKADTAAVLIDSGVISPAEERQRLAEDPDSDYSSLDVDEVPTPPGEAEALLGGLGHGLEGEGEGGEEPGAEPAAEQPEDAVAAKAAAGGEPGAAGRMQVRGAAPRVARPKPRLAFSRGANDEAQFDESKVKRDEGGKFAKSASAGGGAVSKNPISEGWLKDQLPGIKQIGNNDLCKSYKIDGGPGLWLSKTHSTWVSNFHGKNYSGADISSLEKFLNTPEGDLKTEDFDAGWGPISFGEFMHGTTKATGKTSEAAKPEVAKPNPHLKGGETAMGAATLGFSSAKGDKDWTFSKGDSKLYIDATSGKWTLTSPGHMTKVGDGPEALTALLTKPKADWEKAGVKNYSAMENLGKYPDPSGGSSPALAAAPTTSVPTNKAEALREKIAKVRPKPMGDEQGAISDYKGSGFGSINRQARKTGQLDAKGKKIQSWLSRAELPEDVTLYRGVTAEYAAVLKSILDEGTVFRDRGFSSTSTSDAFAENWKKGHSSGELLLKIDAKKGQQGAAIKPAGANDGEYEILLQADSKFKVLSLDFDKGFVHVELIHDHLPKGKVMEPEAKAVMEKNAVVIGEPAPVSGEKTKAPKPEYKKQPDKHQIFLVSKSNPKKAGSKAAEAFAKYKHGMTVKEYLGQFGSAAEAYSHIDNDVKKGYIKVNKNG